jgi:hypothetical protein
VPAVKSPQAVYLTFDQRQWIKQEVSKRRRVLAIKRSKVESQQGFKIHIIRNFDRSEEAARKRIDLAKQRRKPKRVRPG